MVREPDTARPGEGSPGWKTYAIVALLAAAASAIAAVTIDGDLAGWARDLPALTRSRRAHRMHGRRLTSRSSSQTLQARLGGIGQCAALTRKALEREVETLVPRDALRVADA